MVNWLSLHSSEQINALILESQGKSVLIFKHSTRCSISSIAKYRLESDWDFNVDELKAYYLDVINNRSTSLEVADIFNVHHESPQILVIKNGECVYDSSHLDITIQELKESYNYQG